MKKSLLIAAALLSAGSAFASKARLDALQNSAQLLDFQSGFDKPQDLNDLGELVTFEWGTSGAAANPHAEGGFLRKHDSGVYGFYLGHRSSDFSSSVAAANAALTAATATLLEEQNAWNLLYGRNMGDMKIGFRFQYSKADMKKTAAAAATGPQKEDTMGFTLGAKQGAWDAALVMGLSGNSTTTTTTGDYKLKSKSNMKLIGGYQYDTMYFWGLYKTQTGTLDTPAATVSDSEKTDMNIGVVDTVKKDGVNFFYGVSYLTNTTKEKVGAGSKTDTSSLPIIIGIEADAASWLVLRGSVTQDTNLVGGTKNDTGTDLAADNTKVAAGAGVKFNKFMLDGSLTATTGKLFDNLGTNGLMAQTALSYNF